MNKNTMEVFDLHFWSKGKKKLLEKEIFQAIENSEKKFLVTVNPEIVMESLGNTSYKKILDSAHYLVPDGVGINMALNKKYHQKVEVIPGIELMADLLVYANQKKKKCFFYGAKQEVGEKMLTVISKKYPDLKIVGYENGYITSKEESLLKFKLQNIKPDLVFVALGYPKQEEWISKNIKELERGIFIGVGGSFDVLSGTVKRAPLFFRKIHLEWFYRILAQPSRVFRIKHLLEYIILVIRMKRER